MVISADECYRRCMDIGVIVDDEYLWLLYFLPWRITKKGYIEATYNYGPWRKTVKLHHFIIGTPISDDDETDHINGNKLDNRASNLRVVSRYENAVNKDQVRNAAIVRFHKGRYEARFRRNGVTYYGYGEDHGTALNVCKARYEGRHAPSSI